MGSHLTDYIVKIPTQLMNGVICALKQMFRSVLENLINFSDKLKLHNQTRHRLAASCGFYRLAASCQQVAASLLTSSSWASLICCNLIFADLLQVVETTCIKLVDKKSWQSTCIKPVDNLQQACYHQAGASDANASWYWLDYNKATSL